MATRSRHPGLVESLTSILPRYSMNRDFGRHNAVGHPRRRCVRTNGGATLRKEGATSALTFLAVAVLLVLAIPFAAYAPEVVLPATLAVAVWSGLSARSSSGNRGERGFLIALCVEASLVSIVALYLLINRYA